VITFGIDPGSQRTGFGVIRVEGSFYECLDAKVIRVEEGAPLHDRLRMIFERLSAALEEHRPDRVYVESIFHQRNAKSAIVLGEARGVALLAASLRSVPIGELSPAEVKKAVTGRGAAEKAQVQEMVRILLRLEKKVAQDASDALAIAIAGATRAKFDEVMERAVGRR
jgi:crossover junction endodeoxyribonuclease RuvC